MKKLAIRINKMFGFCLTLSILMVASIPGIIFGAINGWWILTIPSIAICGFGFYGLPLFWIRYGSLSGYLKILRFVEEQHYYSVKEISTLCRISTKEVIQKINWLIVNFYLTNYYFDGENLKLNTREKQVDDGLNSFKCPNCGGIIYPDESGYGTCKYCGSKYGNKRN